MTVVMVVPKLQHPLSLLSLAMHSIPFQFGTSLVLGTKVQGRRVLVS
jgi:hypothetical protein